MPFGAVRAGQHFKQHLRATVPHTSLSPFERDNAHDVWRMQLGSRTELATIDELYQLLERLQVPMQPVLRNVCQASYDSRNGRFAFSDFTQVLEQCKTLHSRWLHKVRGRVLDDDMLEAYIAVGGNDDASGTVDMDLIQTVANEFHLEIPFNGKGPSPPGSPAKAEPSALPSGASVEFEGFVKMLRRSASGHRKRTAGAPPPLRVAASSSTASNPMDDGRPPRVEVSSMVFLEEDDLNDLNGNDKSPAHASGGTPSQRKGSTSMGRRASMRHGSMAHSMLPPVANTPQPDNNNAMTASRQGQRSHSSLAGGATAPAATSPNKGSRRSPQRSKLPAITAPKRQPKKNRFANW